MKAKSKLREDGEGGTSREQIFLVYISGSSRGRSPGLGFRV